MSRWKTSSCQACLHGVPCSHFEQHARVIFQCSCGAPGGSWMSAGHICAQQGSPGASQHTCLLLTCGFLCTSTPLVRRSHPAPGLPSRLRCCATTRRCSPSVQITPCSLLQFLQGTAPTVVRGRGTLASPRRCGWAQTQAGAMGGAGPSSWPAGSTQNCW